MTYWAPDYWAQLSGAQYPGAQSAENHMGRLLYCEVLHPFFNLGRNLSVAHFHEPVGEVNHREKPIQFFSEVKTENDRLVQGIQSILQTNHLIPKEFC